MADSTFIIDNLTRGTIFTEFLYYLNTGFNMNFWNKI